MDGSAPPSRPLIVQSDLTLLLETESPLYAEVRDSIAPFAEIVKTPEYVHTYRLSTLSLWNAASAGHSAEQILSAMERYSRYEMPPAVRGDIRDIVGRFGRLRIEKGGSLEELYLASDDRELLRRMVARPDVEVFVKGQEGERFLVKAERRGHLKKALVELGYPALDLAGYAPGEPLDVSLRETAMDGTPSALRKYQADAVQHFLASGSAAGGTGVVALPCGAGKTLVGLGTMAQLKTSTLILCPNNSGVTQWKREIVNRTTLGPESVGEYTGLVKQIAPVTLTTYAMLTHRGRKGEGEPQHFDLFFRRPWGLIIYDEVHLLPAPVFRITAELQSVRRLGLTATLVREDGKEGEVFALVGPKRYDVPWREMERQGWIAPAECEEIRVELPNDVRAAYLGAKKKEQYGIAARNPLKVELVRTLARQHASDPTLIIGQFLDQLKGIAETLDAPLITGATREGRRRELYDSFRRGEIRCLVVSKVANFAIDLPEASVAIQVSGTFGSRQEEAQRLGRILRPKTRGGTAHFYAVVSKGTVDQDFALQRELFLVEQGYRYTVTDLSATENPDKVPSMKGPIPG